MLFDRQAAPHLDPGLGIVMTDTSPCPCGSALPYEMCCALYHQGRPAENASVLMRSRYSAYARNIVDYVMRTTHPANPSRAKNPAKWKQELIQFVRGTQFVGLKIIDFADGETSATVTFTAYLIQGGRDATFTEKSTFVKVKEHWLYRSGEIQRNLFP